jgi:endo-1,4-beta-xylanase
MPIHRSPSRISRRSLLAAAGSSGLGVFVGGRRWLQAGPVTAVGREYTLRELANGLGLTVGGFGGAVEIRQLDDPEVGRLFDLQANQFIIGFWLNIRWIFGAFNAEPALWRSVLDNWGQIEETLNAGSVPAGYWFNWDPVEKDLAFARAHAMSVRAEALLWGADIPDSIRNGDFTNQELERLIKFMVKTRVNRYRGQIAVWDGADEAVTHMLIGHGQPNGFWYDRLGSEIIDKVFTWAHESDPDAKLMYVEDHAMESDTANFRRIQQGYIDLLQHFQRAGVPVNMAGIENNLWIYAAPSKADMVATFRSMQALGFQVAVTEATVNIAKADPFWGDRKVSIEAPNPLDLQAMVYRDMLEACLEVGADFALGGQSDTYSWLAAVGHPETKAMTFNENNQPKPAYYALVDTLRQAASL